MNPSGIQLFLKQNFDIQTVMPLIVVAATALLVLLLEATIRGKSRTFLTAVSLVGLGVALLLTLFNFPGAKQSSFYGMVRTDAFAQFFTVIALAAGSLTLLLSANYLPKIKSDTGEFHALVLLAVCGMILMAIGNDLIVLFLGIETMSIAMYILCGIRVDAEKSNESSLKYLLLGAFASAFLLFGIALIYGATGTTNIEALINSGGVLYGISGIKEYQWDTGAYQFAETAAQYFFILGVAFVFLGFAFKIGAVPFHMWTPDVYQGAPTSVTGFMAVGVKAAAFAALIRVFLGIVDFGDLYSSNAIAYQPLMDLKDVLLGVIWLVAVLTMTLGNLSALIQTNLKRMLAFSSIAHAGYALVGVSVALRLSGDDRDAAVGAVMFYLLAYMFMNLGAFGVVIMMNRGNDEGEHLHDYNGLASYRPLVAAAMAVFMFSLAGIPPTAGFVGKFYIFSAAVSAGTVEGYGLYFYSLAIIGVLNSIISVYYYLYPLRNMYFVSAEREHKVELRPLMSASILISTIFVLWIGVMPKGFLSRALEGAKALFFG
ncbi:MAG: NADH-quinone oxidoreductase subunit N [Planctomycetota bacterium]|nr:MAG: NADH-quinone oxidoreductase subunit N [Planctomycetota bacterium]